MTMHNYSSSKLVRTDSYAVINNDKAALDTYMKERAFILEQQALAKEVHTLRDDISNIKALLQQLVHGK